MPDLEFFDLDGPGGGVKYANGNNTSGTTRATVLSDNGTSVSNEYYLLFVTGLSFKPEKIILYYDVRDMQGIPMITYSVKSKDALPTANGDDFNYTTAQGSSNYSRNVRTYEYSGDVPPTTLRPSVGKGWFTLPVFYSARYRWEAFGSV